MTPMITDALARSLLYPAPQIPVGAPPPGFEAVDLDLESGATATAWAGDGGEAGAPVVLFFHGNGENLETMRLGGTFDAVDRLGVACLAVDYPGYGRSSGRPSEEGLEAAADAALAWARERWPRRPVVAAGWSLGAAAALGLTARAGNAVRGLVALSAWTRLEDVATLHFPTVLVRLILSESYDSLSAAERIRRPALVVHGERDELIPVEQGRRIAEALENARWVPVARAGHNDLLSRSEVWNAFGDFLAHEVRDV